MQEKEERKHREGEWGHFHWQQQHHNHHRNRTHQSYFFSVLYLISLLLTSEFLTSCCHLTSSQLAKVYISCTWHLQKLTATSSTSSSLHILPASFANTSCRWQQRQHLTSATSVEWSILRHHIHHHSHFQRRKITSSLPLGANDKIADNIKETYNSSSTSCVSWWQVNVRHVEFYVLTPGSHHNIKSSSCYGCPSMTSDISCVSSMVLQESISSRRSTHLRSAAHICLIKHASAGLWTAMLTAWSGQPQCHLVQGSSSNLDLLSAHDPHRQVAGEGSEYVWQVHGQYIDIEHTDLDNQHHSLQRSNRHQVQQWHGHRLTSEAYIRDFSEQPVTSLTSDVWMPKHLSEGVHCWEHSLCTSDDLGAHPFWQRGLRPRSRLRGGVQPQYICDLRSPHIWRKESSDIRTSDFFRDDKTTTLTTSTQDDTEDKETSRRMRLTSLLCHLLSFIWTSLHRNRRENKQISKYEKKTADDGGQGEEGTTHALNVKGQSCFITCGPRHMLCDRFLPFPAQMPQDRFVPWRADTPTCHGEGPFLTCGFFHMFLDRSVLWHVGFRSRFFPPPTFPQTTG